MYKRLLVFSMAFIPLLSGDEMVVKITDDMPYVYTVDTGERIKVQRIQDTNNKLTDDYTRHLDHVPPFLYFRPTGR